MTNTASAASAPDVFSLSDEDLGLITRKSTREAKPSILLAQVQQSVEDGERKGVRITPEFTPSIIINNLNKAQAALGIKLRVWNRADAAIPFIAFQVKTVKEETAAPAAK